jgi:outer membrane protein TolC
MSDRHHPYTSKNPTLPLDFFKLTSVTKTQLHHGSIVRMATLLAGFFAVAASAQGQVSLTTAVDLALSHSPKVKMAEADVAKSHAALAQARDVYVPAVTAGAGLGESYGYSPNPPTLFTFNAGSLVYNSSQNFYVRSARFGVNAANLSLRDARQAVAEDAALTFVALQHDQQREAVLQQQNDLAARLVTILEDRFAAGKETAIDVTTARLTAAQFRVGRLRAEDNTAHDRDHLALLMGVSLNSSIRAEDAFPDIPSSAPASPTTGAPATPAIAAAYATAEARHQAAVGDARYLYRPQFSLIVQYNRYATFTNSFKQLQGINNTAIGANEGVFAVSIQIPMFDKERQAKARESLADAMHAHAEADNAQLLAVDGQLRLNHSIELLRAQTEVAKLDQQLAQQQLEALSAQLNASSSNPNAPPLSPKDEQNSRIAEREKYLALIDADFQLRQAEINLLRESGQIEQWLQQAAARSAPANNP